MVVTIKILANSQSVNKIVLYMPINFTSTIYRRKSNAAIKLHTASTVSIADQLQLLSMRGSGKIGIESRERQALTTGEPWHMRGSDAVGWVGCSPSRIIREGRARITQVIAWMLVTDFALWPAASVLETSLWLASHEDYKFRAVARLRA